jgi:hypothetical protein
MKHQLTSELEQIVISTNTCLKEVVSTMDLITLLRNAHPTFRSDMASKLEDAELLTKSEASEFVKIVGR